jgi:hypothetical protein
MSSTKSKSGSAAQPPATPPGISVFLDRIEEELAVLVLDGRELKLARKLLPEGTKEGEYLTLSLARDPETTKKMQDKVKAQRDALTKDDDGGDIAL